jgi:hypothetical protein
LKGYNDLAKDAPETVKDAVPIYSRWVNGNYMAANGSAIRRPAAQKLRVEETVGEVRREVV